MEDLTDFSLTKLSKEKKQKERIKKAIPNQQSPFHIAFSKVWKNHPSKKQEGKKQWQILKNFTHELNQQLSKNRK